MCPKLAGMVGLRKVSTAAVMSGECGITYECVRSLMLVWRPLMLLEIIVSFSWKVGSAGIIPSCVGVLEGMRCLALRRSVTGERRLCEVLV